MIATPTGKRKWQGVLRVDLTFTGRNGSLVDDTLAQADAILFGSERLDARTFEAITTTTTAIHLNRARSEHQGRSPRARGGTLAPGGLNASLDAGDLRPAPLLHETRPNARHALA